MPHSAFIIGKDDARDIVRSALAKSCDSPYEYYITVDRRQKFVVISRENGSGLPEKVVPSWSLKARYSEPGMIIRVLGLSPFFVYNFEQQKLVLRRQAISMEMDEKMSEVIKLLISWIMDMLYGNI